jgi:hypothetical protein
LQVAPYDPWWAIPAATLAGVIITVAATTVIEYFRGRREKQVRFFEARRQEYTGIESLVKQEMRLLADGYKALQVGGEIKPPQRAMRAHRLAAAAASLISSPIVAESIDYHYQCVLEAWQALRRSKSGWTPPKDSREAIDVQAKWQAAETAALDVTNNLRRDLGVPGSLRHSWF